ncbi:MAG: hypothetical protein QW814_04045 [Methanothrix sp.]
MSKYIAIPLVVLFSITMISFASSPTGVAFPKVNPSHVFLYLNSTDYINYTITVYNGTASNVTVGTSPALAPYGINVGFIPDSGLPPYSGKIRFQVNANAIPGNYTAYLATSPSMSNTHGVAAIYIVVYNRTVPVTSTSSVPTTTISPSNTVTTAPTTTPTTVAPTTTAPVSTTVSPTTVLGPDTIEYLLAAIVVIIIIAIIVYLAVRRKRW